MKTLIGLTIIAAACIPAAGNLISDGDFTPGTTITGLSKKWNSEKNNTNQWYSWEGKTIQGSRGTRSRRGGPAKPASNVFYEVDKEGFARPGVANKLAKKLLQVIEAPEAGTYDFNFGYRLTNDADQYSVVRVFGIKDTGKKGIKLNMSGWDLTNGISGGKGTRIYDQGGRDSHLSTWNDETFKQVNAVLNVTNDYDYLVAYAAFSYDGKHGPGGGAYADVTGFSINPVPEPTTIVLLTLGGVGLLLRRVRRTA